MDKAILFKKISDSPLAYQECNEEDYTEGKIRQPLPWVSYSYLNYKILCCGDFFVVENLENNSTPNVKICGEYDVELIVFAKQTGIFQIDESHFSQQSLQKAYELLALYYQNKAKLMSEK